MFCKSNKINMYNINETHKGIYSLTEKEVEVTIPSTSTSSSSTKLEKK